MGRISHVEGNVSRYVPEEDDWVATVKDAPFGVNDAIYSDRGGRAEIMMPNNTWTRIDGDTRIRLNALRYDVTEIDVDSGVARFYNKGSDAVIKAKTTFGYVMAPGDTTFDLYVGDDSVEAVASKGTVYFVHSTSETKFEVIAGSSSILADSRQVTAGEARTDPYWHAWNRKRDALWAKRMRIRGKSVKYLPPSLHHEAYVLEENGRWERVYYEGTYHYFWRPRYVSLGWAPFTAGRWVVWYGDHTW
ncbi:MAG: FecR domain-containing protein, partial [Thermodesulfobacteriota bacterium]